MRVFPRPSHLKSESYRSQPFRYHQSQKQRELRDRDREACQVAGHAAELFLGDALHREKHARQRQREQNRRQRGEPHGFREAQRRPDGQRRDSSIPSPSQNL